MNKGLFISFEGLDGCGKSTASQRLYDWMESKNIDAILTKEPGSPHVKECVDIRKLLLGEDNNITSKAELMLFLADRNLHVENLIVPNLEKGIHVISDRYADSTRIYQQNRGFSRNKLDDLLEFATNDLVPDITFLLDVEPEVAWDRINRRNLDRMENEGLDFHRKVRDGFLRLAESFEDGHRFYVIKATDLSKDEVFALIEKKISELLWL